MSSWIKLIDQFTKTGRRNERTTRLHRAIVSTNIEDDSSQENCDLNSSTSSSVKRRKVKSLENLTIENGAESSDDCCDVDYNPDGSYLPIAGKRKIKKMLPIVVSSASHQSSSSRCTTSTTESHPWQTFDTISKPNNDTVDSSFKIDESLSDSNSSDKSNTHTLIDESSTDASCGIQSPIAEETMIETQDSITPPVAPFIANAVKLPKERKVRVKKGGMVERLKKSLSQAKSNLLFWQHHRSAELVPPGISITVHRVEKTYGRTLLHTNVNGEKTVISFCSKTLDVQQGDVIEVNLDVSRSYRIDNCVFYSYVDKVLLIRKKNG